MGSSMKTPARWWVNKATLMLGQDFSRKGTENETEIIGTPACGAAWPALVPLSKRVQ